MKNQAEVVHCMFYIPRNCGDEDGEGCLGILAMPWRSRLTVGLRPAVGWNSLCEASLITALGRFYVTTSLPRCSHELGASLSLAENMIGSRLSSFALSCICGYRERQACI